MEFTSTPYFLEVTDDEHGFDRCAVCGRESYTVLYRHAATIDNKITPETVCLDCAEKLGWPTEKTNYATLSVIISENDILTMFAGDDGNS